MTLPVTIAADERLFSTLKRLKLILEILIEQARLNDIAPMNIYRKIKIHIDEFINEASTKARRFV